MHRPLVLAALVAAPLAARAQASGTEATVDLGASRVAFAGGFSATALSVAPALRRAGESSEVRAAGSYSAFADGGWSLQGTAGASAYTPARSFRTQALRGEIAASLGGNIQGDGTRGGQALALARAHAARGAGGAWIGLGGGRAWEAGGSRPTLLAEAAVWRAWRDAEAMLVVTPTRAGSSSIDSAGASASYSDVLLAGTWSRGAVVLDASAGGRVGHRETATVGWGGLGAAWSFAPRLALVLAAGSYPVDPTQGFPGGRYASIAVRALLRPRPEVVATIAPAAVPSPAPVPAPAPVPGDTAASESVRAFAHAAAADGRRVVRVHAPGARTVELMGDFTDWAPLRLDAAADGWWVATLAVAPGVHQLNVRVNGGAWLVPPGLRARPDELGGAVGVWLVR